MADYLGLKIDANELAGGVVPHVCYQLLTDELNSRLTLTVMESEATIAADAESEALPADFLEPRHMYVDGDLRYVIEVKSEFSANAHRLGSGIPTEAVIVDGNVLFNAIPDVEHTVKLRYLAKLSNLSADTDTTPVMDAHYSIYLYGVLKHYAMMKGDDRLALWSASFESAVRAAEMADTRKRYGGSPLVSKPIRAA